MFQHSLAPLVVSGLNHVFSTTMCIISRGNKSKLLTKGLLEMSTHLDTAVVSFPLIMGQPGRFKNCTSGFACFGPLTTNC